MTGQAEAAGEGATPGAGPRGHVRRSRLLRLLEADDRVAIVRAEGGAGKTILVAEWVRSRRDPRTVWVTVDDGIVDARSFWFRTFASLMSALPASFHDLTSAYSSGLIAVREGPALLASALLADPRPLVLVFDDLHHVDDEVQEQLVALVRRVPHLRLVATTRRRTRFEAPLMRAALDVRVIGSPDLAFTRDELSQLAAELPFAVERTDLAMLERVTGGHTLTTRLALFLVRTLSAGGARRPTSHEVARGLRAVATDFLPQFEDEREERLAVAISLCPEVDEALADSLDARAEGWPVVQRFEERGLGRITMRRSRPVFLMHTLVASALRHRAEQVLTAERTAEVRAVAYARLADLADPIDLLTLLVEAEMDAEVFPHFVRNFSELSLHRTRELVEILGALSDERLSRTGSMAIALATAMSEGSVIPQQRAWRLAQAGVRRLPEPDTTRDGIEAAMVSLARFAALRVYRDYEGAAAAGEESLARIEAVAGTGRGSGWYPAKMQFVFTAMIAMRIGRVRELSRLLDGDTHPGRSSHLNALVAFAHAYAGDMPLADRHLAAIDEGRPGWRGSHYAIGWHLASALRLANAGEADAALDLVTPLLDELHRMDLWPAVVWTRGAIQLTAARSAEGLADLDEALTQCRSFPVGPGWSEQLQTLRAELLTSIGDVGRARRQLGHPGSDPASQLARARFNLLLSQPHEALAELDAATSAEYLPGQRAQRALLQAAAHARLGNEKAASTLADAGVAALERLELRLPLSLLPADALDAVRRLTDRASSLEPVGSPFAADRLVVEALSKRETVVLGGLTSAKSLEQLAASLHVSPNTVRSQVRSIYRKLGVTSRAEAIHKAARLGLL